MTAEFNLHYQENLRLADGTNDFLCCATGTKGSTHFQLHETNIQAPDPEPGAWISEPMNEPPQILDSPDSPSELALAVG